MSTTTGLSKAEMEAARKQIVYRLLLGNAVDALAQAVAQVHMLAERSGDNRGSLDALRAHLVGAIAQIGSGQPVCAECGTALTAELGCSDGCPADEAHGLPFDALDAEAPR